MVFKMINIEMMCGLDVVKGLKKVISWYNAGCVMGTFPGNTGLDLRYFYSLSSDKRKVRIH